MQLQLISWNRKGRASMAHIMATAGAKTLCDNIPGNGTGPASLTGIADLII